MKPAALALGCLLVLTLAGCGGDDKPAASSGASSSGAPSLPVPAPVDVGTLKGRLILVGGPSGTAPQAVPGKLTLTAATGTVVSAEVGQDGRFEISLAPGSYTITGTSPKYLVDGKKGTCATDPAVTELAARRSAEVQVVCAVK